MRTVIGSLTALAAACLLTISLGHVAYAQIPALCTPGADTACPVNETPVPGVRIVRQQHYPNRPAHYVSGDLYTTLAEARETRDKFAVVDLFVPPGGGPIAHTHAHEWEIHFVLQGTVNFYVGVDQRGGLIEASAGPGTAVYTPICRVMGFVNRSGAPARTLLFALPGGIDNFFHLAGDEVVHYDAPIPPSTPDQTLRSAFWGDREGNSPYFPGLLPPPVCPGIPNTLMSSVAGVGRPLEVGPFGETRVVLASPAEVGRTTGATAFCGGGPPDRPGGTVKYAYFTLPNQSGFPPPYISPYPEVVYVLSGSLTFLFNNTTQVQAGPLTYVEIQPGVLFSVANIPGSSNVPAQALSISVISPVCQPPPQ